MSKSIFTIKGERFEVGDGSIARRDPSTGQISDPIPIVSPQEVFLGCDPGIGDEVSVFYLCQTAGRTVTWSLYPVSARERCFRSVVQRMAVMDFIRAPQAHFIGTINGQRV